MWFTKWRFTSAIFSYVYIAVLCKKNGETYGDLGDEIIVDYPSQPTRKNQIPKRVELPAKKHKIEQRTIMQKTLDHYVNPLYYREFIPDMHTRGLRARARVPLKARAHNYNKLNTWRKKDFIHRPLANRRPMANYIVRPSLYRERSMNPLYPRTLGITVRKTQAANQMARHVYRSPPAVKSRLVSKPRFLTKPMMNERGRLKHHIHMQIIPKAPFDPIKAEKMGIHSGFVLLPAQSQKSLAQRTSPPHVGKTKTSSRKFDAAASKSKIDNRFSERKHIWIPSKHINAQEIPIQEMTSYHVDDIGNLIPDNDAKSFTTAPKEKAGGDPLLRNLGKVAMKWAEFSPSLRRNMKNNPGWMDALEGAMKPSQAETVTLTSPRRKTAGLISTYRTPLSNKIIKQLPRPRPPLQRKTIRRVQPKSARRILYFAHNAPPANNKFISPRNRFKETGTYARMSSPAISQYVRQHNMDRGASNPNLSNFIAQLERSLGPPIISKEYEIPKVSSKVYRYINRNINDKAVTSPARRTNTKNPLIKYLQYHRSHGAFDSPRRIISRKGVAGNMQQGRRTQLLRHQTRAGRHLPNMVTSLTNLRERRSITHHKSHQQNGSRRSYGIDIRHPQPLSALFRPLPRPPPRRMPVIAADPGNRGKVPWNFYHNEVMPDGRIRPALYPISHHIPPGKCLPDGSLCDQGHDEQCCGASAFCQDYWGISKCVAYSKVTLADMHNPFQIQQNRIYKHFYRYMLDKVELK